VVSDDFGAELQRTLNQNSLQPFGNCMLASLAVPSLIDEWQHTASFVPSNSRRRPSSTIYNRANYACFEFILFFACDPSDFPDSGVLQ
jgi:hypothetical protein